MRGSDFVSTLPENNVEKRELLMLDAVRTNQVQYSWRAIDHDGVRFFVMEDALRWGDEEDSIRLACTAQLQQWIADDLGCMMLTPKMVDLVWQAADVKLEPMPRSVSSATTVMVGHSDDIDNAIGDQCGLVAGWKDWCLSKVLWTKQGKATNYGWHVDTTSDSWKGIKLSAGDTYGKVIQPSAEAHSLHHVDYSQLCRLALKYCEVDGRTVDVLEVLDRLSHEGMLPDVRHPGVEEAPGDYVEIEVEPAPMSDTLPPVLVEEGETVFRQAKHYRKGRRSEVLWVVIHTAEMLEVDNGAEALMNYAATMPDNRKASWHYAIDRDSVTQSVLEEDTAWHAGGGGVNDKSIGIEHAGYANQKDGDWHDAYSTEMLQRSARLCAAICARHDIPVRHVEGGQLKGDKKGICGHNDVGRAFKKTSHTDPGPHFPWQEYLAMVTKELAAI